jgi:tetratricopeptide (TPR) repeat protein
MARALRAITISLGLAAIFLTVAAALTIRLAAQARFDAAQKMAAAYRWNDAQKLFGEAMRLDPFDSRYPAAMADLLVREAGYRGYKEALLGSATALYERAIRTDPRNAELYLKAGLVELRERRNARALEFLMKAVENDPNGFGTAYAAGLAGLGAWKEIDGTLRQFILNRLKAAIAARPSYAGDVYLRAWRTARDIGMLREIAPDSLEGRQGLYDFIVSHDLWQFRKEEAARLEQYLEKDRPGQLGAAKASKNKRIKEIKARLAARQAPAAGGKVSEKDWALESSDGKLVQNGGSMYGTGAMYALIDIPPGPAAIVIRAKGQPAKGVYPYMIVELDGDEIGEAFADGTDWKEYRFGVNTAGGTMLLSVTFVNDWYDGREDRNLLVGTAEAAPAGRLGR